MTTRKDDELDLDPRLAALVARARAEAGVPEGFAGRVLAQVAVTPQVAATRQRVPVPVPAAALEPAAAFWLRAAVRPPVVLAFLVAGVIVGWSPVLVAGGSALALAATAALAAAAEALARATFTSAPALRDPVVLAVVLAALAVPLALLALNTTRAVERWTVRLAGPAV